MRWLLLLVATLAPAAAAAARGKVAPRQSDHARGERTIDDVTPELVIRGGYYSGLFGNVAGMYCDKRTGEIYVVDRGANAIEIFSESGAPLFAFADDEHLAGPRRVAVDAQDRIYVLDDDRTRIKVFDYRGEFLTYLVPPGFEAQERLQITALTFAANGDVYVGESASGQVAAYDRNFRLKLKFGEFGDGPEQFSNIVGIAADDWNIYVASQQGIAVQVFSRQGRFLRGWGHHDAGIENVSLPAGIAVDAMGRVILLDTLRQEIKYFDSNGLLIEIFGGQGEQPGAVSYPQDLSMDRRGRLCVADTGNMRAQVLRPVDVTPGGDIGRRPGRPPHEAFRPPASPPLSSR